MRIKRGILRPTSEALHMPKHGFGRQDDPCRADELGQGLYIITTDDGFPCKVGVTSNLRMRVDTLQTGNWVPLKAVWFSFVISNAYKDKTLNMWSAFSTCAAEFETVIHAKMTELDLHMSGEWFAIDQHDCRKVIEKVASDLGIRLAGVEMLESIKHYKRLPARSLAYVNALIKSQEFALDAIARGMGENDAHDVA